MDDPSKEPDDFSRVVQSLANGLRSEAEIATGSRLPPDKLRSALDRLIADSFVCESLGTSSARRLRALALAAKSASSSRG